jgi:virginiamycin B lyase
LTGMRWCALVMTVLLLASADTAAAQTITEFPIPTAAYRIVAGPDGALWFSEIGRNNIGRITTAGTVTEFAIPAPAPVRVDISTNIAVGSDCALWFGLDTSIPGGPGSFAVPSAAIGRITTSGEVSKFLLPSPFSKPWFGLTSGPDGALWFTEFLLGKRIRRITTAGAVTEFPLPSAAQAPLGITSGADGALWFTEAVTNKIGGKIGRITTTGEFSEFLVPTPNSVPFGITAGPDGALWFTELTGNKIGRITTTGEFSEWLIPTPNSQPFEITAGPDGALWFTERIANKIGTITTTGEFSEFLVPTPNSGPSGITAGLDGALWFTSGDKIGRIPRVQDQTHGSVPTAPTPQAASDCSKEMAALVLEYPLPNGP